MKFTLMIVGIIWCAPAVLLPLSFFMMLPAFSAGLLWISGFCALAWVGLFVAEIRITGKQFMDPGMIYLANKIPSTRRLYMWLWILALGQYWFSTAILSRVF